MATEKREKKYKDIQKFCKQYFAENGYAPSVREIGDGVGLKSTSSVSEYLNEMKEKRLIVTKQIDGLYCPRAFSVPGMKVTFEDKTAVPKITRRTENWLIFACGNCGNEDGAMLRTKPNYCSKCGCRIDWMGAGL